MHGKGNMAPISTDYARSPETLAVAPEAEPFSDDSWWVPRSHPVHRTTSSFVFVALSDQQAANGGGLPERVGRRWLLNAGGNSFESGETTIHFICG